MTGLGSTPWVDNLYARYWDRIQKVAPRGAMPTGEITKTPDGRNVNVREYGIGHYGVVMPTTVPGVLCKITTDSMEAAFIATAIQTAAQDGVWPDGMTRYHAIYAFPENVLVDIPPVNAAHDELRFARMRGSKPRTVSDNMRVPYILWRQEAEIPAGGVNLSERVSQLLWGAANAAHVAWGISLIPDLPPGMFYQLMAAGLPLVPHYTHDLKDYLRSENYSPAAFQNMAAKLDRIYRDGSQEWGQIMARMLAQYDACCWLLSEQRGMQAVGKAMEHYRARGVILADVHGLNVGYLRKPGTRFLGITDPGHAVPLAAFWQRAIITSI